MRGTLHGSVLVKSPRFGTGGGDESSWASAVGGLPTRRSEGLEGCDMILHDVVEER